MHSEEHDFFLLKQHPWSHSSAGSHCAYIDSTACAIAKGAEKHEGGKLGWRLMCSVPVEKVTAGEVMGSRQGALEAAQLRNSAQSRVSSGIQGECVTLWLPSLPPREGGAGMDSLGTWLPQMLCCCCHMCAS